MPSGIELLARDLLDERELKLGLHLASLIDGGTAGAQTLMLDVLPTEAGARRGMLVPELVYRPLTYLCLYSNAKEFDKVTGVFLDMISAHIEGALRWLTLPRPTTTGSSGSFGSLAIGLYRNGNLSQGLADRLVRFNKALSTSPARGPVSHRVKEVGVGRGASGSGSIEGALALVMMRKLSIQIFALLKSRGINMPKGWSEFKEGWLSWI